MKKKWFIALFVIFLAAGVAVWFFPLLTIQDYGWWRTPDTELKSTTIVMSENFKPAYLITLFPCLLVIEFYFHKKSPLRGVFFILQSIAGFVVYLFAYMKTDFHMFIDNFIHYPAWYVYHTFSVVGCLSSLYLGIRYVLYHKDDLHIEKIDNR